MPVFNESMVWDFDKLGHRGKKFATGSSTGKAGFLLIEIDGSVGSRLRQRNCDFAYYVLNGSGTFIIDDTEYACRRGDLVIVPAGSVATYEGTMKLFLVSAPPWSAEQEDIM